MFCWRICTLSNNVFINVFFAIELFELIIILSLFHVITFWLSFPKLTMNTQQTLNEQGCSCRKAEMILLSPAQEHSTALLRHFRCSSKTGHRVNNQRNPNTSLKGLVSDWQLWACLLTLSSEESCTFFPRFSEASLVSEGDKPLWYCQAPLCQKAKTWTNSLQCGLIKLHRSCFPGKISVGRECGSKGTCPSLGMLYCHTEANILWEFHGVDDKLYYRAP